MLPTGIRSSCPNGCAGLIAGHIGVCEEQVVLGAGASGVVMQVLHAVTRPGDRIVLSEPTFDGYPIFSQMARLTSVTIPLDKRGHHDLEAMAEAAADASVVVLCRPHNPTGTLEPVADVRAIPAAGAGRHRRAAGRGLHRVRRPPASHRRTGPGPALSECRCVADVLQGLWAGRTSYRVWLRVNGTGRDPVGMQLPFGMGITSLTAVAASYDAEDQLRQRILRITGERDYLRRRLRAMGIYTTDCHANFVYLPAVGRPMARGIRRHRAEGPLLPGRRCSDHRRKPRVHPSGIGRSGKLAMTVPQLKPNPVLR